MAEKKAHKHPGGAPPKYTSREQIEGIIEQYFSDCAGKVLRDRDDNIVLDKYDRPIIVGVKPLTVAGLALALGFTSRQSLLNYQGKAEFVDTITRAKLIIEEYNERRLYDKDGVNGAKFNLLNNFKGYSDKQTVDLATPQGIQLDLTGLSVEDLRRLADKL